MDKEKIFSFYEKMYFREIDEMNTVLSRFPILIAGVALIVNAYIFLFKLDGFMSLPKIAITLIVILILLLVGRLLFCLFMTFRMREYKMICQIHEYDEYKKGLIKYEKDISKYNEEFPNNLQKESSWEDLFRENLEKDFMDCSKVNSEQNESRRNWFHKSMRWIWINMCFCITIPALTILITIWV